MRKSFFMIKNSEINSISGLIFKVIMGRATQDECGRLNTWRKELPENELLYRKLTDNLNIKSEYSRLKMIDPESAMNNMKARIASDKLNQFKRIIPRLSAAAAILIFFISALVMLDGTIYNFFGSGSKGNEQQIKHGEVKAVLTLGNGKSIALDDTKAVIKEGSTLISKSDNGSLSYKGIELKQQEKLKFNDLQIPRGGEFSIVLEDGTKVWLNAESKLRYPVAFVGDERKVYLEGEAYFKVAKGSKPFLVDVQGQVVKVYGTEFNISAYPSGVMVYTTLIEGKVSVQAINGENNIILEPGTQSVFNKNSLEIALREVNTEEVVSWRTGMIVFEYQTFDQIMQTLSRWYDFEYQYTGKDVSDLQYKGKIPRYGDFNEVLRVLEECGGVKLNVKGKMVTIIGL